MRLSDLQLPLRRVEGFDHEAPVARVRLPVAGYTLVELSLAIAITAIVAAIVTVTQLREVTFVANASSQTKKERVLREGLREIASIIEQSSVEHVDTTSRLHLPGSNWSSDKFEMRFYGLRQCTSSECKSHTGGEEDQGSDQDAYYCAHEYIHLQAEKVHGRIWTDAPYTCPLDETQTSSMIRLDGFRAFSARNAEGQWESEPAPSFQPRWNSMVLVFPFVVDGRGLMELRRYDIHVSDLMAGESTSTLGWKRFDPEAPTMIDLLDFGTDGGNGTVFDGSIPTTAETSDADYDTFLVANVDGDPTIVIYKVSGSEEEEQYHSLKLEVRLRDGKTSFSVIHRDSADQEWSASREFRCNWKTIVSGVTEFAVSTRASSPFDADANPTGVKSPKAVRLTIGTADPGVSTENRIWMLENQTLTVMPMN